MSDTAHSSSTLVYEIVRMALWRSSYTSVDELCAVSDIEDLYYNLTHET